MNDSRPEPAAPTPPAIPGGTPPLPSTPDPRLEAFWQQAQAFVAVEQGLTAACHVRLATLAQELGLTDDEFQQALSRFRNPAEPLAPPSLVDQQVARFQEYVERKLGRLTPPMLDFSREQRWVSVASERYGVDEPTARRIIATVAAARDIRRITHHEARQIAAEMVTEKVGSAVWIDHVSAKRLVVAGQVWGLTAEEVDELIRQHTLANRAQLAAERRRRIAILAGVGGLGAALLIFVVWQLANRRLVVPDNVADTAAAGPAAADPAARTPQRRATPNWWDGPLVVAVTQARTWHRSFAGLYDLLAADDPVQRGTAYERLVGWSGEVSANDDAQRSPAALARDILASALVHEPDGDAAGRLRAALTAPIAEAVRRGPRGAADIQHATWAIDVLLQGLQRPELPDERARSLRDDLSALLEVSFAAEMPREQSRRDALAGFARQILRHAARVAASDSRRALELHDAARETAAYLPPDEFQRLQTAVLVAALPVANEQWVEWRPVLHEAVAARDALLLIPLIELYERGGASPWRDMLGELLRVRSLAAGDKDDPAALARSIREALGLAAATTARLPVDAWTQLRPPADAALARCATPTHRPEELLERAVELAHWTTLAAAVAHGDAGRHVWEQGWRDGPPKLSVGVAGDGLERVFDDPAPVRRAVDGRLLAQRRVQLNRLVGSLEHFERLEPVQRVGVLRGIGSLAADFVDLVPAQGQILARYLLSQRSDAELREGTEPAKVILAWRQVRLGLADHLPAARLAGTPLADLLTFVLGRPVGVDEVRDERDALRRELLANALAHVGGIKVADSDREALVAKAEEAAAAIHASYVRRASLWALEGSALPAEPLPGQAVAALARHLAARQLSAGRLADLDRRWLSEFSQRAAIAEYQSLTDVHRFVAWQRLLLRLSATELARVDPAHAAAAAALVSQAVDQPLPASQLLDQLVQFEAAQLRLWLLAASPAPETTMIHRSVQLVRGPTIVLRPPGNR